MPGLVRPQSSRLLKLEVENFKSYKGRQDIGPFHSFTAVIGPNGSGKSNLMDAISFVLGVKGAQLRGSLKELLCSVANGGQDGRATSGYVKLLLETEDGNVTTFQRSISQAAGKGNYVSVYAINEATVTWASYEEKLKSFGILIKARNFLVFQGDIEAVAGKQGLELTKLFETISGSDTYKAEFDELEAKRKAAQERLSFVQSKKRNTAAEKRQKREQKAEAEKHIKMQQELDQLKCTYFLWRLFCLDSKKQLATEALDAETGKVRESAKALKKLEKAVKENKDTGLVLSKRKLALEQTMRKQKSKALKENPQYQKVEAEVKHLRGRIRQETKDVESSKAKDADRTAQKEFLQAKLSKLEADGFEGGKGAEVVNRLDDEVYNEAKNLELKAQSHTAKATNDLRSLEDRRDNMETTLADLSADSSTMKEEIGRLNQRKQDKAKIRDEEGLEIREQEQQRDALQKALTAHKFEMTKNKSRRELALERKERAERQLRENSYHHKEADKHRKTLQHISELKRLFKGVHGRLSDLGRVPYDSYKIALAVTMSNDMDSVVVDSERTAKDCVAYLKQHKIPPMTFLPLQTIKVKAAHPRLRNLGGTAKVAIDLVVYKPEFERAFMSACGSTIVCDTGDEARHLAFGQERHKVVTKDGLLISKSGAMTGGGTAQIADKAGRFDEAEQLRMREEYDKNEALLKTVPTEEEGMRKQLQMESDIKALSTAIARSQKGLAEDTTGSIEGRLAPLEEELAKKEKEIEGITKELDKLNATIKETQARITQHIDKIFAPLSEKVGVNIREYLEKYGEDHSGNNKAELKHKVEVAKLQQQIKKFSGPEFGLAMAEQKLKANQAKLKEKEEELAKFAEAAKEATEAAESQAKELAGIVKTLAENNARGKELKGEEEARTKEGIDMLAKTSALRAHIETWTTDQQDILSTAALEQVALPKKENEDEEMDDEGPAIAKEVAQLDFTSLSRQHRATASSESAAEKMEVDFQKDIEERREVLNRVAPNLKAVEQYEEAKDKDDKERAELESARQENSEAQNAYHTLRQQRSDVFMAAFDHIKDIIDSIYKDLTKSSVHPMGGTAYLSLTSAELDPFASGISFTAMPPSKRWRQMESLSGGEKTVAALALLFAIHSYHPAPFFILDEVDAALDALNVAKVANYIRERTRTETAAADFQAIVISLKDYFFSKADALVGVTKTPGTGCSTTFTLDLTQYPESAN